jgi:hypothetical protein
VRENLADELTLATALQSIRVIIRIPICWEESYYMHHRFFYGKYHVVCLQVSHLNIFGGIVGFLLPKQFYQY